MTDKILSSQIQTADTPACGATDAAVLMNRRQFLFGAGAAVTLLSMPVWMRRTGMPARLQAQVAEYPRQLIGQLSRLPLGEALP